MKIKFNLKYFVLFLFTFVLFYFPNFSYYIGINGLILYLIFLIIYIFKFLLFKDKKILEFFKDKVVFFFIIFNILFTLYYIIRTSLAGTSLLDVYNLRIVQNLYPIFIVFGVIIIFYELDNMKFNTFDKYKFIINVATFQGLLALLMIIFPSFRNVAYNIFYQGNSDINIYISASRLYGICDGNYTYSFQILHSFLAIFALYLSYFYKKTKLLFNTLIILLVTILNGRTGLIIFFVGIIILLLYILIKEKKLIKFFKIVGGIFLILILMVNIINVFLPSTVKLFSHAINDVLNYSSGKINDSNETRHLLSMIFFPSNFLDFIFGAGYRVYGKTAYPFGFYSSSDIGFVNDIFMCGIFTILFLYNSLFLFFKNIIKKSSKFSFEKLMSIFLLFSFIISNFKGEFFRSQMQISVVICILYFMYMRKVSKL